MFDQILVALETFPLFLYGFTFVLSLLVGSFLNVVIYRLPEMMQNEWDCDCRELLADELKKTKSKKTAPFNLAVPESHCPKCKHKVKPWQNIPVVSYLLLKGKCGNCDNPISFRYPAIELLTAFASLTVVMVVGFSAQAPVLVLLTWLFVALIFIDIDHMLLPDQITQPALWLVLVCSLWGVFLSPKDAIIGAASGYMFLWVVFWGFKLITGKDGMGYGDFKLMAVVGGVVGVIQLPMVILLSSAVGAVIGLSMMAFSRADRSTHIPFGPYIAIAGWITMLWGDGIFAWYLRVFV